MVVIETTTLGWWIIEKIVFLILIPIGFYIKGYIDGYTKRSKQFETNFDFEKERR